METNPEGQGFTTTIIPGLAYKIKLLIFGAYYRGDLYKHLKYDAKLKNSPEFLQYLEEQLQDERITEDSFCETTYLSTIYRILSAIYMTKYQYIGQKQQVREFVPKPYPYSNPSSGELRYWQEKERERKQEFDREEKQRLGPKPLQLEDLTEYQFEREGDLLVGKGHKFDMFFDQFYDQYATAGTREGIDSSTFGKKPDIGKRYFQYVLFGTAAITKFEDISDGLYMHDHIKLFSAGFLFHTKIGPHEGNYNDKPGEFMTHDLNHLTGVVSSFVETQDYTICATIYRKYRPKPSSFVFRYVCIIIFLVTFEDMLKENVELKDLLMAPHLYLACDKHDFQAADNFYVMKWILDAMDVDPDVVSKVRPILDASNGELVCKGSSAKILKFYSEEFVRLE